MTEILSRPRGTRDILNGEAEAYQRLEDTARGIFGLYGYRQLRIPTFEDVNLFSRGIGDSTDIVQKEMYVFKDKKGRKLALRPEGTAGIVRAYIENNLAKKSPVIKVFHYGPMFRYERPQAGRYREFYQVGAEYFGSSEPSADAEVILMAVDVLEKAGLKDLVLYINSLGCSGCRNRYRDALKDALSAREEELCSDCRDRMKKNPLRVLDCKKDGEKLLNLPDVHAYLCDDCRSHFGRLQKMLNAAGCAYEIDRRLVRGLDYYTRTIFEIKTGGLSKTEGTVLGGGRYDGLVGQLGGVDTPACGFALGMERVTSLMEA